MSEPPKPSRTIISLQIGGIFFALANVVCVAILAWTYVHVKLEPRTLEVKGSAKKEITSDIISWTGTITARDKDLIAAYTKLKGDADKVAAFVKTAGLPEGEITFSSITTSKIYAKEVITPGGVQPASPDSAPAIALPPPSPASGQQPLVITTNRVELYELTQCVTVESKDMKIVPEVSRNVTSLIKDGVEIDSGSPRYLYTKLSELKIDMLADASKDATTRATQVVTNANGKLGKLVEAKMGVMQINPKGSSATSAEGNNDTTSFEKEITAVVTVEFELD